MRNANSNSISLVGLLLFSFLLIGCSTQQTLPSGTSVGPRNILPNGLEVHDYKMPNGMRVILVPNDDAPVFYIQTLVQTGSVQEALDPKLKRTGLAHLFEHMMFRGTKKYPGSTFDKMTSAAGQVGLNATTWFDRTNYFINLPKEKLEMMLELESNRFEKLIIDKAVFEKEIGAVVGELKLGKDNPNTVAYQKLMNLAFADHPYGHPVIGLKKDVESFSVEEAIYFYRKYYSPNNFTILIVGDIEIGPTIRLIKKYYGHMKPQEIPEVKIPPVAEQLKPRSATLSHHAAKNRSYRIGYKIPLYNHVDTIPLLVVSSLLGDGDGSLLKRTMLDAGLVSSVGAYSTALKEAGIFSISAQIRPGVSRAKIESTIKSGIQQIASGRFSEKELKRAKNTLLLYSYYQINSNGGVASSLVEGILNSGDYMRFFNNLDSIKKVTKQDIIRVAKYYLKANKSSSVYMTPENKNAKK